MKVAFFIILILALSFSMSLTLQILNVEDDADQSLAWATGRGLDEILIALPFAMLFSMFGLVQFYLKSKNSDLILSFIVMALSWLAVVVGVAAWR